MLKIIPRAVRLLDYTARRYEISIRPLPAWTYGAGDEVHGESGDDTVYGGSGNDVLFGEAGDDDLIGGVGQ